MLQDIAPSIFDNTYHYNRTPQDTDLLFCFDGKGLIMCSFEEGIFKLPCFAELKGGCNDVFPLFSIDGKDYYFTFSEAALPEGYAPHHPGELMHSASKPLGFAAVTALQLASWYRDNKYCGRCGSEAVHGEKERSLVCPNCGNTLYPKISPVVIVCVTDGDRLLLTKYAGREYAQYALIAGFCEIGETPEDTVRREVMEEAGVRVKNIRYYASQPWGLSSSLLLGFFAELDGSNEITVDTDELSEAGWFKRDEVKLEEDNISLTRNMIMHFLKG